METKTKTSAKTKILVATAAAVILAGGGLAAFLLMGNDGYAGISRAQLINIINDVVEVETADLEASIEDAHDRLDACACPEIEGEEDLNMNGNYNGNVNVNGNVNGNYNGNYNGNVNGNYNGNYNGNVNGS